jgi:phosphatidate cytidylyltransferase
MADTSKKLLLRVISALLAAGGALAIGIYLGRGGLIGLTALAIVLSVREFLKMLFGEDHRSPLAAFYVLLLIILTAFEYLSAYPGRSINPEVCFPITAAALIAGSLWFTRNKKTNEELLSFLGLALFGLVYCVYFPVFAIRLVRLSEGPWWFLFMLLVVFSGDTFAYFGGRFFGSHKLMPQISPNKTVEGAIAGIFGSCLAGTVVVGLHFPTVSVPMTILFCAVCGFIAQAGDLFVSLVKRVSKVKDSGHIMPGHGGILDRLDGVFIACPLIYAFALYWNV